MLYSVFYLERGDTLDRFLLVISFRSWCDFPKLSLFSTSELTISACWFFIVVLGHHSDLRADYVSNGCFRSIASRKQVGGCTGIFSFTVDSKHYNHILTASIETESIQRTRCIRCGQIWNSRPYGILVLEKTMRKRTPFPNHTWYLCTLYPFSLFLWMVQGGDAAGWARSRSKCMEKCCTRTNFEDELLHVFPCFEYFYSTIIFTLSCTHFPHNPHTSLIYPHQKRCINFTSS